MKSGKENFQFSMLNAQCLTIGVLKLKIASDKRHKIFTGFCLTMLNNQQRNPKIEH